ncbi:MAG: phenylalanine--tRNA ligase subunit beta [Acidobacteriota bacterium]
MQVPLSWLRDFVAIADGPEALADRLTFAGLEVEEIEYVGLAPSTRAIAGLPAAGRPGPPAKGLAWDPATIVIARILEVMPHPNADRLTLLRVDDGTGVEHIVLTGAPNLLLLKGTGPLVAPMKVVFAREGAILYDGHRPGREVMTLRRAKIRGVESKSMVCSEKELGISDDHEGIIVLDADAPVGVPAADYMGDVVFTVKINPNMARNANIYGIAREVAAITGVPLKAPDLTVVAEGTPIDGRIGIDIRDARLNPRFVLGLIEGVTIRPSPYWVQRRLRLVGTRPISNIVDATNYAMFELGEPLHAFDWDVIARRAGARRPTIITRLPERGETLTTLDGVERELDVDAVLVCDEQGALSMAGVMGGAESEVSDQTTNVLLEGAAWDFINIRKTAKAQNLPSEASYRFSRGVHPALADQGVRRGLALMRRWGGGTIAAGLVDSYPGRPAAVVVEITAADVERQLGVRMGRDEIVRILESLEFECESSGSETDLETIRVIAPEHRLDIGTGTIGRADLLEEIARIYGYERIPNTMLAEVIPPPHPSRAMMLEERARDVLAGLGLQEIITYSLTSPERESRLHVTSSAEPPPYLRLANPIVVDRVVMRRTLLPGVLEVAASNARNTERLALFEIGHAYLVRDGEPLPEEQLRLSILMAGPRTPLNWQGGDRSAVDYFDVKGVVEDLADGLVARDISFEPSEHDALRPGRTARVSAGGRPCGWMGELHPVVAERFDLKDLRVVVAELELDPILAQAVDRHPIRAVPAYPPIKEDLAFVLDQAVAAVRVRDAILRAGSPLVTEALLFDDYIGEQIGEGRRSLAFQVTYQAPDRTLTDGDAKKTRERIARALGDEFGAVLRG